MMRNTTAPHITGTDAICPHCTSQFRPPVLHSVLHIYRVPCCGKLVASEPWCDPIAT
jgi:hypothetical protein